MASSNLQYKNVGKYIYEGTVRPSQDPINVVLLDSTYHPIALWATGVFTRIGDYVQPSVPNGHYYLCTEDDDGVNSTSEPIWPTNGGVTYDGDIEWTDMGTDLPLSGGKDDVFADVSAFEIVGAGYVAGGQLVTSITLDARADRTAVLGDDVSWDPSTITCRWAVKYINDTVNGVVKPLLSCVLLDNTPADVTTDNSRLRVSWNNDGVHALAAVALP